MTLAVGRADAGLMMLAAGCLASTGDHMSLWDAAKQGSINLFFHFERLLQLQDCDAVVWPERFRPRASAARRWSSVQSHLSLGCPHWCESSLSEEVHRWSLVMKAARALSRDAPRISEQFCQLRTSWLWFRSEDEDKIKLRFKKKNPFGEKAE